MAQMPCLNKITSSTLMLLIATRCFVISGINKQYHVMFGDDKVEADKHINSVIENAAKTEPIKPNGNTKSISGLDADPIKAINKWIKTKFDRNDNDQVGIVILLENYSKFTLSNPMVIQDDDCILRKRVEPNEIGPNEYGVIAFDNNGDWNDDSCGSVSWQILQELEGKLEPLTGDGEDEKGRRLNIAFFTSFKNGCKHFPPNKRHNANGHQLLVLPNELNENKKWKNPNAMKNVYTDVGSVRGHKLSIEKYDMMGKDLGGKYYRFIARSEYIQPNHRPGCNPILRIQFLPTEKNIEQAIGYSKQSDPEIRMWVYIGLGLVVFAGVMFMWVLFNRSTEKKRIRGGSFSKYGATDKSRVNRVPKGRREKDDLDGIDRMMPIEPSKVVGEYSDKAQKEAQQHTSLFEVLSSLVESVGHLLRHATNGTLTLPKKKRHSKQNNETEIRIDRAT